MAEQLILMGYTGQGRHSKTEKAAKPDFGSDKGVIDADWWEVLPENQALIGHKKD